MLETRGCSPRPEHDHGEVRRRPSPCGSSWTERPSRGRGGTRCQCIIIVGGTRCQFIIMWGELGVSSSLLWGELGVSSSLLSGGTRCRGGIQLGGTRCQLWGNSVSVRGELGVSSSLLCGSRGGGNSVSVHHYCVGTRVSLPSPRHRRGELGVSYHGGNSVSVHHYCVGQGGTRCQFIIIVWVEVIARRLGIVREPRRRGRPPREKML